MCAFPTSVRVLFFVTHTLSLFVCLSHLKHKQRRSQDKRKGQNRVPTPTRLPLRAPTLLAVPTPSHRVLPLQGLQPQPVTVALEDPKHYLGACRCCTDDMSHNMEDVHIA